LFERSEGVLYGLFAEFFGQDLDDVIPVDLFSGKRMADDRLFGRIQFRVDASGVVGFDCNGVLLR